MNLREREREICLRGQAVRRQFEESQTARTESYYTEDAKRFQTPIYKSGPLYTAAEADLKRGNVKKPEIGGWSTWAQERMRRVALRCERCRRH